VKLDLKQKIVQVEQENLAKKAQVRRLIEEE
jgi:hypothetical protein